MVHVFPFAPPGHEAPSGPLNCPPPAPRNGARPTRAGPKRRWSRGWQDEAFLRTAESVTGPIASTISHEGIDGLYGALDGEARDRFDRTYEAV